MKLLANAKDAVALLADRGPLSPAEVAEHLALPRSSVYRLLDGLAAVDLVSLEENGTARLHLNWLHLSDAARTGLSEWSRARAVLDALSEQTGQTAFLSIPRGDEAVCIDWSPGRGIGVLVLRPGRALPSHAGGAGRVLLAFGTEDLPAAVAGEKERFTRFTKTTAAELVADVETSRHRGFVHSDQDVTVGIGAVAVPVLDPDGRLSGCLSLAGLAGEVDTRVQELAHLLLRARADL